MQCEVRERQWRAEDWDRENCMSGEGFLNKASVGAALSIDVTQSSPSPLFQLATIDPRLCRVVSTVGERVSNAEKSAPWRITALAQST
mmetsp:Transcript_15813/g.47993  ORF Transcript_15813/g.47993 Transcript_15813/m.47993 type:complete len:88 (-) Transcript_15813:2228-2491(-)